jgi:excisionase family DNA binding protein
MPPKYLTVKQAAEILNLSVPALYMRIHRGTVPYTKLGARTVRFDPRKLKAMMESEAYEVVNG